MKPPQLNRHTKSLIKTTATKLKLGLVLLAALLFISPATFAQCDLEQLSNPSFEVGSGSTFNGWNQFGVLAESNTLVAHGNRAAQLSKPIGSGIQLSALWQNLTSAPGDIWQVKVDAGHLSSNPLSGAMRAIVNIEWYNAAGIQMDYESTIIMDANTPVDHLQTYTVTSSAAPANTASMHIFIAALQLDTTDTGAAIVDNVFLAEQTGQQISDIQWKDFPGGRTLNFGGQSWRVKGTGVYGPGPNTFSDSSDHVWVDSSDRLHMQIKNESGNWVSTEITSEDVLGYGDYRFTTVGRLDTWAPNVVFGFFHWQYPFCFDGNNPWNLHSEMDVEISRWGIPGDDIAQFVVQPYQVASNINRFNVGFANDSELTTFAYRWFSDRIEFRAWKGGPYSESSSPLIYSWVYTGPYIPREDISRMHLNFWQFGGPPSDGQDHEIILDDFVFVPEGTVEVSPAEENIPISGLYGSLLLASLMIFITRIKRL